jgi:hypothetical protein
MVTQIERQRLIQQWSYRLRQPRTTVCKCATGLLLLIALAHFGSVANGRDGAIEWTGAQPPARENPETARQPG